MSYDSPETLRQFADSRKITFPLISDAGSMTIRRYGLLNETVDPKSVTYGIPHPGTFIVDRKGVVVSRFFEDAYQERFTTGAILGGVGGAPAIKATTTHLSMTVSISDTEAAPGERLSVVADTPAIQTMRVGETVMFSAKLEFGEGGVPPSGTLPIWSSTNPAVIVIDHTGRATAVGEGTAAIEVGTHGHRVTRNVRVTS